MNSKTWMILVVFVALVSLLIVAVKAEPQEQSVRAISQRWVDSGHADRKAEAFTHWNGADPPMIPAECAKCHSTYGYLDYLGADGSTASQVETDTLTGTVLYCNVCHNEPAYQLDRVSFPSGVTADDLGREAVCMQCHQGLESTISVDKALAGKPDDVVDAKLGFINIHYFAAAATQMGGEAKGGYQYAGLPYAGRFPHTKGMTACIACHDPHSLAINPQKCSPCHANVVKEDDLRAIRAAKTVDYNGNGDIKEGMAAEISGLQADLYQAIRDYAAAVGGKPIVYDAESYPYFFSDTNNNGTVESDEAQFLNRYTAWTPRLVRAAYNYQVVQKDPGAFAHNPLYIVQILYDSLYDLGTQVPVDMQGMVRPEA